MGDTRMSDDPFAEPDDSDRTVIRPAPGGRRTAPQPALPPSGAPDRASAFEAAPPPLPTVAAGAETIQFGTNPLIVAAAPLLQLVGRLRRTYSAPNADDLRERTVRQVRQFETAARDAGVPNEQLRPAHFALCASIDDMVLNTPWGSSGAWGARSLVLTFHQGTVAGVRFFEILDQLKGTPATYLPVLELMYYCLSLGFLGKYRLPPHRPGEIDRIREDLYTLIVRQRPAVDPALAPHWEGVKAPYKPARAVVPTWVMAALALGVIGGLFAWFSTGLNAASDDTFQAMLAAPLPHAPEITRVAPVRPPELLKPPPDPVYVFLKPEIDQGLVTVIGDPAMPIVRISNKGMFASGSATLNPGFYPLLGRIGDALRQEKGPVQVIGYTDNQRLRPTVRFPSNYQLSVARAAAAREIILKPLADPARVTALGKADADPIAPNDTEAGREENRRIEVVLRRQG
jgi:type VI secretion system protein ImpK